VVYVVDAPALVVVPLSVADPNEVFLGLTALLNDGELCFCNEVVDELERTAKGEAPLVWVSGNAANRVHRGPAYNSIEWVAQDFPAIVDTTVRDTHESAALYVCAQALELSEGRDVTVVTEDLRAKPTRTSLACEHFELRWLALLQFLNEVELLDDEE
jgi:hypothetical protein